MILKGLMKMYYKYGIAVQRKSPPYDETVKYCNARNAEEAFLIAAMYADGEIMSVYQVRELGELWNVRVCHVLTETFQTWQVIARTRLEAEELCKKEFNSDSGTDNPSYAILKIEKSR